jgi:hypothetical protein
MTITPADIRDALALPPMSAPSRRLPKSVLAQHGAANSADRKLIDSAIERLDWWATLSAGTVGITAGMDDERPVPAIQLLAMAARTEPSQRLLTLIHRAIPVPIILATALPGNVGTWLSLAPLRRAERIADQMVVERLVVVPDLTAPDEPVTAAFLASLALPALPQTNLAALYTALIERAETLEAARLSRSPFLLPVNEEAAASRRDVLAQYAAAHAEWLTVRGAARREKRLADQVALGSQAQLLKERLAVVVAKLGAS